MKAGDRMIFKPNGRARLNYARAWMGAQSDDGSVECEILGTDMDSWGCSWMDKYGNPCALQFAVTCGLDQFVPEPSAYFVRTANGLSHLADPSELKAVQA